MNVMILDADVLVAELLEALISGLFSRARIRSYRSLAEARSALPVVRPDLVICDWDLPDGWGLDLVREVRRQDREVPVLMVSEKVDRERVLAAGRLQIQAFMPKPFTANAMQEKLKSLLPTAVNDGPHMSFEVMLRRAHDTQIYLPAELDPAQVMAMLENAGELSVGDLAEAWKDQPAVTARLLDVANTSALRRSGEPCNSLRDAIRLLGIRMCLNQVLALALDISHRLSDPVLKERGRHEVAKSTELASLASLMGKKLGVDATLCYTAGLLHRIGELAVLSTAQQYIDSGGALDDDDIERALHEWSGPLGNVLKVAWRLPLPLRNLIGAVYMLTRGSGKQIKVVMRAAWLMCNDMEESEECQRLLGRLGLDGASARAPV